MKAQLAKWCFLTAIILTAPGVYAGQSAAEKTVLDFVSAFNQQDVDAMLILASEDLSWMSIAGSTVAVEAAGSQNMKAAMLDYFAGHPASRSKIIQIQSSGTWVTTLEQAGREIDGQFEGQCAYAMYQLEKDLIKSVWYFSAHQCDPE